MRYKTAKISSSWSREYNDRLSYHYIRFDFISFHSTQLCSYLDSIPNSSKQWAVGCRVSCVILVTSSFSTFLYPGCVIDLPSSPGHSQILSRSHGEKSGEGLGSKLSHGPEMVDSVSTSVCTNQVHHFRIKSGSGLGMRL